MVIKMVPPDGGWGWMVVVAFALSNIVTIPILQGFGLIFKDTFTVLGISATQSSIIMNVNSAFGMCLGLVNGPLLKKFGYKRICIAGSLCYSTGVVATAFVTSFVGFIITYGLLSSVGMGLIMSSFSLAMNTYFLEKRGRATGMAMTITGLGPIIMPQVISLLTKIYGSQMTILILGGFSLHTIVAALMLQPVEWHMKKVEILEEDETAENIKEGFERLEAGGKKRRRTVTLNSIEYDMEGSIYDIDAPRSRRTSLNFSPYANTTASSSTYKRSVSCQSSTNEQKNMISGAGIAEKTSQPQPSYKWWSSDRSLDTVNLGSSVKIFEEKAYRPLPKGEDRSDASKDKIQPCETGKRMMEPVTEKEDDEESEVEPDEKKGSRFRALVKYFDFDLLCDPIYVNIMLGMSIAISAEMNFAVMTPFILNDLKFTTDQCASVMSILASVDLIFRGITPFIGERFNRGPRDIYLFSLFLLIASRLGLMFSRTFLSVIFAAIGLGVAKGVRTVYMGLVIPSYVPLEKFASASGLQMVCNGLCIMSIGPLLGLIRESSGSKMFIAGINSMTGVTIVMWSTEMFIFRIKGMMKKKEEANRNTMQT